MTKGAKTHSGRAMSILAIGTAIAVIGIVQALGDRPNSETSTPGQTRMTPASTTGLTVFGEQDRPTAPPLQGTTLDGDPLDPRDFKGHVVVLNVWASWCSPCRAEAPDLNQVARDTYDRGVRFLGIDTRDNADAARAFVRQHSVEYPSLIDDGAILLGLDGLIPLAAIPSTVVVGSDGAIAATVVGQVDRSTLRGLVDDELNSHSVAKRS